MKDLSIQAKASIAIAICIIVTLVAGASTLFLAQETKQNTVIIERVNRHLELSRKSPLAEKTRLENMSIELLTQYQKTTEQQVDRLSMFIIIGTLAIIIILVLLAGFFQKSFIRPIKTIQELIRSINQGNLDARLTVDKADEIGQIAQLVNELGETLRRILGEIIGASNTISSFMDDLSQSSDIMGRSAETTKSKTSIIANTSNEISTNMVTVAAAAGQASVNVSTISNSIESFSMNMNTVAAAAEQASATMNGISNNVTNISTEISGISTSVESLSESLNNINKNTSQAMKY